VVRGPCQKAREEAELDLESLHEANTKGGMRVTQVVQGWLFKRGNHPREQGLERALAQEQARERERQDGGGEDGAEEPEGGDGQQWDAREAEAGEFPGHSDEDDAALSEGSRHCRDLEEDNSYPAQMDWEERSCPGSVGPSNELDALDEDMVDHAQPKAAEEGFAECDDQARSDDEASSRGNPADNNDEDLPPREDSGAHQIPDDEIVRNDKDFWRAVINIGPTTIRCPLRGDREDAVQDWLELRDVRVGGDIKEAQRVQRTLFLKRKTGRRSSRG